MFDAKMLVIALPHYKTFVLAGGIYINNLHSRINQYTMYMVNEIHERREIILYKSSVLLRVLCSFPLVYTYKA